MEVTCKPGLDQTRRIVVEGDRVVRYLREGNAVFGTPMLVQEIEKLCHAVIAEHLDDGEGPAGTRADIRHLAATPEGMWVDITARVSTVDRRAVIFEVTARDAIDEVARCTHNRFVVELAMIKERLAAKVEKKLNKQE